MLPGCWQTSNGFQFFIQSSDGFSFRILQPGTLTETLFIHVYFYLYVFSSIKMENNFGACYLDHLFPTSYLSCNQQIQDFQWICW